MQALIIFFFFFSLVDEAIYCLPVLLAHFQVLPAFTEMVWKIFPLGVATKTQTPC